MLGSLPFVSVGQEHDETAALTPLVFGGDKEIVDYHLRTVGEVAELSLPADKRLRATPPSSRTQSERRILRQERIMDGEPARLPCRRFVVVEMR